MNTKTLTRIGNAMAAISTTLGLLFAPASAGGQTNSGVLSAAPKIRVRVAETVSAQIRLNQSAVPLSGARDPGATGRALASADFDEDGVPDLITGYANAQGGRLVLQDGNSDAIYPNSPEANARRARGEFSAAAFHAARGSFALPEAADFLGAGDFDADGHWDIVTAARGGTKLYWLRGDGRGNFDAAQVVEVTGAITALAVGEVNRVDGLTDIAVGVARADGARVLLFESPAGALRGAPESFALAAPAVDFAFGALDQNGWRDLAIASGSEVVVVHGRDRKLSLDAEQRAKVAPAHLTRSGFEAAVVSIAIGDFAGDVNQELAVLASNGVVMVLGRDGATVDLRLNVSSEDSRQRLLAAKVSALPKEDLLVFGGSREMSIVTTRGADKRDAFGKITTEGGARLAVSAAVSGSTELNAVLPMRLNGDALQDIVLAGNNDGAPAVIESQAAAVFVVNTTARTMDANAGNGVCADADGNCSFVAAIMESNAFAGADTINFNIPGGGVPSVATVVPGIVFNEINEAVTIDGTTQPGGRVEVNSDGFIPLIFFGGNSVLRGVAISGGSACLVLASDGNIVEGNYIGFRPDGSKPSFNVSTGIGFRGGPNNAFAGNNNLIGGTTAQSRNVISNCNLGFNFSGTGNVIQGNYVGLTIDGTAALANGITLNAGDSPVTIGGTAAGAGNVFAGATNEGTFAVGLNIGRASVIQGNKIGTTANGLEAVPMRGIAIQILTNEPVTIGGTTPAARNVIAGSLWGIQVSHDSGEATVIQGNYVGTNAAGTGALPNSEAGVRLIGTRGVVVGGTANGARNIISGNAKNGLELVGGIDGTPARNVVVQGNFIGTDVSGTIALPNSGDGVLLNGASDALVGGTSAQARNIISGNRGNGIRILGGASNPNRFEGNYIGSDASGIGALGNFTDGVFVEGNHNGHNIGGTAPGAGNRIAFNRGNGIGSQTSYLACSVLSNSIYSNGGLGIDVGPHRNQFNDYAQAPVVTSVISNASETTISGKLRTRTDGGKTPHTIQFFSNRNPDSTGHGEGETFVGQITISAGSNTEVPFSVNVTPAITPGRFLSAVAVGAGDASSPDTVYSSEFSFNARVTGPATPENTPLRLELITPMVGGDNGIVSATIIGEGISDGMTVVLRRAGQADIIGTVTNIDGFSLGVRFDLTSQVQGAWDVVVNKPDGTSATLPGAFTIQETRQAKGFVEVMGRNRVGPHRDSTFYVTYGNAGNVNVYDVVLLVHLPKGASVKAVNSSSGLPDVQVPPELAGGSIETATETLLPIWLYVLPANVNTTLALVINLQDKLPAPANFEITAELLLPPPSEAEFSRTGDLATMVAWCGPLHEKSPFFIASLATELARAEAILQPRAMNPSESTSTRPRVDFPVPAIVKPKFDDLDRRGAWNDAMKNKAITDALDTGPIPFPFALALGIFLTILGFVAASTLVPTIGIPVLFFSFAFDAWAIKSTGESAQKWVNRYLCFVDNSHDPNEIIGPTGAGSQRYISGDGRFGYSVFFENKPSATAPAQNVVVTDQLDISKFDLSTFSFGPIRLGDSTIVTPASGQKALSVDVDLRPLKNLIVRIIAGLDSVTGLVTWNFQAIDPETGQPPEDIGVGFLPPNVNGTEGEGSAVFNIAPKAGFSNGTVLTNKATIVFDGNPPLETNLWLNTIDNSPPVSQVQPFAANPNSTHFQVTWNGSDSGAGITTYTIFVSENGGAYDVWLGNTSLTSAFFDANPNSSYSFYSVAQDGAGNVEAAPALADATVLSTPSGQLLNISTRMRMQTGDNVLIGGLIITGSEPKKVLFRGIGPSLANVGITNALGDTTLDLFQGNTLLQSNDNWKLDQRAEIEATTIPPTNDLESAIVRTLPPGNYTVVLRGKDNLVGIGVVEAYDLDQAANSKLGNIATRGFVDTADNVMIGGVIVGGHNNSGARVLVRALGPSLTAFGVPGALADPTLELRDGNGALLANNNDWRGLRQTEIEDTTLPPTHDLESAVLETLPAGNYTAIVRGKDNTTGVALLEVYNIQ